jgi:hypothetical protein
VTAAGTLDAVPVRLVGGHAAADRLFNIEIGEINVFLA